MRKTYIRELPVRQFHLLQKFSDQIDHAVLTRHGGQSRAPYDTLNVRFGIGDSQKNVEANRRRVMEALGYERVVSANQNHSSNVQIVDDEFLKYQPEDQECDDIDAFVTNKRDVPLMVQVADCQAILMYDPVKQVIAAVHAGWKGLVKDVSGETLKVMRMTYDVDPATVLVCISPSLGPQSAFFSNPEEELPASFYPFIDKEKRVDLWAYSVKQLEWHGVKKGNIELARICTQQDAGKDFFSFRHDHGITGRFGAVIALKSG